MSIQTLNMVFAWKPKIRFRYAQVGKNRTKARGSKGAPHNAIAPLTTVLEGSNVYRF